MHLEGTIACYRGFWDMVFEMSSLAYCICIDCLWFLYMDDWVWANYLVFQRIWIMLHHRVGNLFEYCIAEGQVIIPVRLLGPCCRNRNNKPSFVSWDILEWAILINPVLKEREWYMLRPRSCWFIWNVLESWLIRRHLQFYIKNRADSLADRSGKEKERKPRSWIPIVSFWASFIFIICYS